MGWEALRRHDDMPLHPDCLAQARAIESQPHPTGTDSPAALPEPNALKNFSKAQVGDESGIWRGRVDHRTGSERQR